jgi:hypothetical protein
MKRTREDIPTWNRCWNAVCDRPAMSADIWCKKHRKVENAKTGFTGKEAGNG